MGWGGADVGGHQRNEDRSGGERRRYPVAYKLAMRHGPSDLSRWEHDSIDTVPLCDAAHMMKRRQALCPRTDLLCVTLR